MNKPCQHERLQFLSGDYYVACKDCLATWMRRGPDRPEYDGNGKIGGAPDLANQGFLPDGLLRVIQRKAAP